MNSILGWIDARTGFSAGMRRCLARPVPGGPCWCKAWPSAIAFAFCVQLITGFFLWMYYSPSAQTAWESVYFLQHEVFGGWLLRAVHHWSAQVLLVLVGLYLLWIILTGAYRAPRELTFWTVVLMGLLTLGLMLTGDLLAWDQNSISSTQVRVNFLNLLPGIGGGLRRLAIGGPEFGHLTLTRFFALHAGLLSGGMLLLLVLHRVLKHRVETAETAADETADDETAADETAGKSCRCWPRQAVYNVTGCLLVLVVILLLSLRSGVLEDRPGVELGSPGDPASSYTAARPEWAFLGLYQFSNLFPGELKILPIFIIPGLLLAVVLAMPWIARCKGGYWFNLGFAAVLLVGNVLLAGTAVRKDGHNPDHQAALAEEQRLADRAKLLARFQGVPAGGALSLLENDPKTQGPKLCERLCASCHNYTPAEADSGEAKLAGENPSAPELYGFAGRDWLSGLLDPGQIQTAKYYGNTKFARGVMVRYVQGRFSKLDQRQRDAIIAALSAEARPDRQIDAIIAAVSPKARLDRQPRADQPDGDLIAQGRKLIADGQCTRCHLFHGRGPHLAAPDLTGYGSRQWIVGILADPAHPMLYGRRNDRMPAYFPSPGQSAKNLLTAREVGLLADWLRGEWYTPDKDQPSADGPPPQPGRRPSVEDLARRWHSPPEGYAPQTGPHAAARVLFQVEHCSICHDYTGGEGEDMVAEAPSAPDLGGFASRRWIAGLLDPKRFKTRRYFGNSAFRNKDMAGYVAEVLSDLDDVDKEDLGKVVAALSAEARLPAQAEMDRREAVLIRQGKELILGDFACTDCHKFDGKGASKGPDLTGYGSAKWLEAVISDPAQRRFYGTDNDGMPSYHATADQPSRNLLTLDQIRALARLIRGESP